MRARRQANLAGTLGNLLSRAANRKLLPGGVLPVPTRFDAAADAPLVRILMQVPCRAVRRVWDENGGLQNIMASFKTSNHLSIHVCTNSK